MHTDQVEEDIEKVVIDFVDYLLPELTPYETTLYLVLLRKSFLMDSRNEVVIGKRTLASELIKRQSMIMQTLKRPFITMSLNY